MIFTKFDASHENHLQLKVITFRKMGCYSSAWTAAPAPEISSTFAFFLRFRFLLCAGSASAASPCSSSSRRLFNPVDCLSRLDSDEGFLFGGSIDVFFFFTLRGLGPLGRLRFFLGGSGGGYTNGGEPPQVPEDKSPQCVGYNDCSST